MKLSLLRVALLGAALGCSAAGVAAQGLEQGAEAPLTNSSVVKLVRAGFREKTVIAIIRARPARFHLTPERLIELKKSGVSERIILAMLAREEATALAGEGWEDDEGFFGESGGLKNAKKSGEPSGVDIFGSSGGARGQTRSRGGSGGGESDTQTFGSASVRIIRPPVEPGAEAKLERTPTLNNNKIVELVEAGFSEGTIIRRIEQSPVEFDLSPEKLGELRKRRVSEPVIIAMRAAMGEEAERPVRPER